MTHRDAAGRFIRDPELLKRQQRVLAELREATIERAVHEPAELIGMKEQPHIRRSQQPINRMTAALIGWAAVIIALAVVAIPMLLSRYG